MKGEGYKFSFKLGRMLQAEEKALKLAREVKTLFFPTKAAWFWLS
jgi:hypothetical protein